MPEAEPTRGHHSAERPITAPWFILRKEALTSPGDSLVFAVLWSALPTRSPSRGLFQARDKRRVRITNAEIAKISGIRGGARAVKYHLKKLEQFNYIKRYGNHRNREIEILAFPFLAKDRYGLVINPDILHSNLSPTKKLLTAIHGAFSKASRHYICDHLGMSDWLYYTNIKSIRLNNKLDKKSNTHLSQPPPELDKKSKYKGISLDARPSKTELLSSDNNSGEQVHPVKINKEVSARMNNHRTLWHTHKVVARMIKANKTPIPEKIIQELHERVFPHKHLTTHKVKTTLIEAAKVIQALSGSKGLTEILPEDTIERIVARHVTDGLDPAVIRRTLRKQFTQEERIALYERLSNSMSPDYIIPSSNGRPSRGRGGTISLYHAAVPNERFTNGFCRLLLVWLKPPVYAPVKPQFKISPETKEIFKLIRRYIPEAEINRTNICLLQELEQHYQQKIKPLAEQYNYTDGYKFSRWLNDFCQFAYNKVGEKLHLGWLKLGNLLFQEWEKEFIAEMQESYNSRCRADSMHKAFLKREAEEREQSFREAYGL